VNAPVFQDFVRFAKLHVTSGDIDPTYPVLKAVYEARGYTEEQRLWFTLLYLTWYRLDSAEAAFEKVPAPNVNFPDLRLPTGTERRGFRGNARAGEFVSRFVEVAKSWHGGLAPLIRSVVSNGGEAGWARVRKMVQGFRDGGPWSSYKFADLLAHVHGYPITADNIGVGGASATAGPIPGMVRVTGVDWKRCALDVGLQKTLLRRCLDAGVPFSGLDQMETSLCDFNSLCKGRYYVGHDIDDQQERFKGMAADWWQARQSIFDHRYLGEFGGWDGVRKPLNRRYLETGEI
jgi:hypothetical protein